MRSGISIRWHAAMCSSLVARVAAVVLTVAWPSVACQAASGTWSGSVSTAWGTSGNWVDGNIPGTTTSPTAGTNADLATFNTATSTTIAIDYGSSTRNLGGLRFEAGAGPYTIQRSGSNSTRLLFSLGDEVSMAADVTQSQLLGRIGLAGSTGSYTFRNDSTTPAAKLVFGSSFQNNTTGPATLVLAGSNPGGADAVADTSMITNLSSAAVAGALTVEKSGAGAWLLEGSNAYTGGTILNAGSLFLRGSAVLGPGTITVNGGGFASVGSNRTFANTRTWQFNGDFVHGTEKTGSAATTIEGTVSLGNQGPTVTLLNTLTLSGVVSGSGGLAITAQSASRSLNLSAANTYTGPTSVLGGVLNVNGSTAAASSVTVAAGGVLSGTGTVGGATAVSGVVSPAGSSLGTLTVANNVTWNGAAAADSSTDWAFALGAGNASDRLAITAGNFLRDTSPGSGFRFDFGGATDEGTFTLVQWSGTTDFLATDFSHTSLGPGFTGSFTIVGNALLFTSVPEPAAGMAALVAAGSWMLTRGWRRAERKSPA